MAQIDDAVLVLKKPTSGTWIDESSYGHVVTPVGTPVFNVDHFETTRLANYFSIANHAVLEVSAVEDLTWMVICEPATDPITGTEKWRYEMPVRNDFEPGEFCWISDAIERKFDL